MRLLFWSSLSLILVAYAGFPIALYCRVRLWPRPIVRASICPTVSIVLAVRNEARYLSAKLQNLSELDYPADRVEVIVVSDGSTDATNKILESCERRSRQTVFLPEHSGKASALNHGVAKASGEIIVFTDARQTIAADALKNLLANFADPSVGCVSGELMIRENPNAPSTDGVGMYWRLEKKIRDLEGLAGSMVGATGAFYAVRKHLVSPLPKETILDDVYIPLQVVRQDHRVVCERTALVWDDFAPSLIQEFRRKVRTLVGNYQLLQLTPWVVTRSNPVRFQFVCHKLLRLLVPFALVGLLVPTISLRDGIFEVALDFQLVFYALAVFGAFRARIGIVSRLSNISLAFIVLNAAAATAFIYFITGKKVLWAR